MANIVNGTSTGSGGLITTGDSSDELQLQTAETARVTLTNTAVVVNEDGNDLDFRVEGDTDANLLFVDAGNDRVGIGTSTPAQLLQINGSSPLINIRDGANNNPRGIEFDYGGSQITGSLINYGGTGETALSGGASGSSGYFLTFKTNGTERLRVLADGGLTFNGDTAAANALDDYEEGTWTPSVGGTATYIAQTGRYTKIGRLVIAEFIMGVGSLGTGSNTDISGLPYAISSVMQASGSVTYFQNLAISTISITPYGFNGTAFRFYGNASSAATISGPLAIFGSGAYVQGNLIYTV